MSLEVESRRSLRGARQHYTNGQKSTTRLYGILLSKNFVFKEFPRSCRGEEAGSDPAGTRRALEMA